MKRSPLRRSRPKVWRRKPEDKVTPAVANYVAARDRVCVFSHRISGHECHDRFGNRIAPDGIYELDHVDTGGMGNRGASVATNLVRLCPLAHLNKTHMARLYRPILRDYLRQVEGSCWSDAA